MDYFGKSMALADWRERMAWGNTQGRTLERQAEGARLALVAFACGDGKVDEARRMLKALQEQAAMITEQVEALSRARVTHEQSR